MNTRKVDLKVAIGIVLCAGVAEGECLTVAEGPIGFVGGTVNVVVVVGARLDGEVEVAG